MDMELTWPEDAMEARARTPQNISDVEKWASIAAGAGLAVYGLSRLKSKLANTQGDDLADQAVAIGASKVLAAKLEGADAKSLREAMDKLKDKLKSAAIVLGAIEGERVTLIAGVTSDLTAKVKAGELVNFVAQQVGGKGGGRPDMAQAGGTEPANLRMALDSVPDWVRQRIA
jgi:alanyl-tRNA synthetase